jgi:glycine reductase
LELTLAIHQITDLRFGDSTYLDGSTLVVDRESLTNHLLEDSRLQSVDMDIANPGEACRIGVVFDIIEPRVKEPGAGSDYPGILGPIATAGQGTTHVLRGAAVTLVDEAAPLGNNKIVEMSGPASEESPYSVLHHLAIVPHTDSNLERHTAQNALRLASVKTSVFLAKTALGQMPNATEVFQSDGPTQAGRDGLPRVAYIGQIHSRQRVAEVDEQILYGANTAGMVPVMLHPNEWLDGGVVSGYQNMGVETYFYQNHPVISELYRWHREGKITLVGTIATMAASDNSDRERNCMLASEMAKWNLAADGVVLTKYGGGAPHADMALTARLCEQSGIFTTVQVSDMSRDRQAESALLFNYPEVDAIVYVGGGDTNWDLPAVEKVVAGNPAMTAALEVAQEIPAGGICGVTSQQGISKLRCFVY